MTQLRLGAKANNPLTFAGQRVVVGELSSSLRFRPQLERQPRRLERQCPQRQELPRLEPQRQRPLRLEPLLGQLLEQVQLPQLEQRQQELLVGLEQPLELGQPQLELLVQLEQLLG